MIKRVMEPVRVLMALLSLAACADLSAAGMGALGGGGGRGGGGGGGGGGDAASGGDRYIVHHLTPGGRGGATGTYMVIVDTENHLIAVFVVAKDGSIVPAALRNYTWDLLLEEYPHEKLPKEWEDGFSSWDVRAWYEDLKTKELIKKEGKKKDEIKEEDLAPPIGSGVGKTQVMTINTVSGAGGAKVENLMIIDHGSHKEDSAGVIMLTYELGKDGVVPTAIRILTQDFNLAKYKMKKGGVNSHNGDFKNVEGESKGFHVKEIEEFIKKQQEKEEKKDEKDKKDSK